MSSRALVQIQPPVPLGEDNMEPELKIRPKLIFSKEVLGEEASSKLKEKLITQTIRSDKEAKGLEVGGEVEVILRETSPSGRVDKTIGTAKITSIDKVRLSELDTDDALRGVGVKHLNSLYKVLHRAGFRFKALSAYVTNRIGFVWNVEG